MREEAIGDATRWGSHKSAPPCYCRQPSSPAPTLLSSMMGRMSGGRSRLCSVHLKSLARAERPAGSGGALLLLPDQAERLTVAAAAGPSLPSAAIAGGRELPLPPPPPRTSPRVSFDSRALPPLARLLASGGRAPEPAAGAGAAVGEPPATRMAPCWAVPRLRSQANARPAHTLAAWVELGLDQASCASPPCRAGSLQTLLQLNSRSIQCQKRCPSGLPERHWRAWPGR